MKMSEKYRIQMHRRTGIETITEYGHFMFIEDILQRLRRLEYLEKKLLKEKKDEV